MTNPGRRAEFNTEGLCHIVREHEFDAKLKEIAKEFDRILDLDTAIDWALQRNPNAFEKIDDDHFLWVTEDLTDYNIPPLRILYTFDKSENTVYLIDIEISETD